MKFMEPDTEKTMQILRVLFVANSSGLVFSGRSPSEGCNGRVISLAKVVESAPTHLASDGFFRFPPALRLAI